MVFKNLPHVLANAKCTSKLETSCDSCDVPAAGRHKTMCVVTGNPRASTQNLFVTSRGWAANLACFFFYRIKAIGTWTLPETVTATAVPED